MELLLIGSRSSTCTQRVLMVLAEKNIVDFTLQTPDMMAGEHKKPPITDKQPFGVIPILEHDGFTLTESRAICKYLATAYANQGTKLLPDLNDLKASSLYDQWASAELTYFDCFATVLVAQYIGLDRVPEIVDFTTGKLSEKMDIYEGILSKQNYMGGSEFSLIDIFYMPYTQKLFEAGKGNLITDRPHVKAWWERVTARDSWKVATSQ